MCNKTITRIILFLSLIFGLYACAQNTGNKKPGTNGNHKTALPKEKATVYSRQDTLFHVKRLVLADSSLILLTYDINTSQRKRTVQTLVSSKKFSSESEAAGIMAQNKNDLWIPQASPPVLLVQVDSLPGQSRTTMYKNVNESLNMIRKLGQKTDSALQAAGLGSFFGGNISEGGLNLEFGVDDIEQAIPVILEVLAKNRADKNIRIARRVSINVRDLEWFYEVIYPVNFSGVFVIR